VRGAATARGAARFLAPGASPAPSSARSFGFTNETRLGREARHAQGASATARGAAARFSAPNASPAPSSSAPGASPATSLARSFGFTNESKLGREAR